MTCLPSPVACLPPWPKLVRSWARVRSCVEIDVLGGRVGTKDWEYAHVSLDDPGPGLGGPGRNMPFEARDFGQG